MTTIQDLDVYVLGRVYDMLSSDDAPNFAIAVPKFARDKVVLPIKRKLMKRRREAEKRLLEEMLEILDPEAHRLRRIMAEKKHRRVRKCN